MLRSFHGLSRLGYTDESLTLDSLLPIADKALAELPQRLLWTWGESRERGSEVI